MIHNKRVIISMTSWKKRIEYVGRSIYMMLNQTIRPDEIILTLACDEFCNGISDLPDDIQLLIHHNLVHVKWVKHNTRAFKKVIPVLHDLLGEDCFVITIDDDWFYDSRYIKIMTDIAIEHPNNYITPGTWGSQPHGYAMIYNPIWFTNNSLWSLTYDEMNRIVSSDEWMQAVLLKLKITPFIYKSIELHITDLNRPNKLCRIYSTKQAKEYRSILISQKINEWYSQHTNI